jgi:predicted amidohydrolase YtcJ
VFPTRHDIDAVIPDRPVFLVPALTAMGDSPTPRRSRSQGITRDSETPFGGEILKDADGEPTGMLIDRAHGAGAAAHPGTTAGPT